MANDFQTILHNERKQLINLLRSTRFTQLSPDFIHQQIIPFATYSPWEKDSEFGEVYEIIRDFTLVDKYRCYELWDIVRQVAHLQGDIIEVGVWKGGTGALIAKAAEINDKASVYLCDTFEGVVKAGEHDTNYKGGEHADTSRQIVEGLLTKLEIQNTEILQGIFPDDFRAKMEDKPVKFCHIDVDTYGSALGVFEFVWPRLVTGGAVAFDDYGIWGCEGVTKMFNELVISNGFKIYNLNGHGIIIKTGI